MANFFEKYISVMNGELNVHNGIQEVSGSICTQFKIF